MNPKISIIVPCYNVEQYLDRCMETLVGQTLQDIEIILVDDKSPDNVPMMCDEWARKDERIKVIHKTVNEGLGYARNTGLEIAKGEYIAFFDSDDWVEQDMFERLYEECVSKKLDVIYSEFNVDEYPGYRIVLRDKCLYCGEEEIEKLRLDIVGAEPNFISSVKFQCSACKGLYSIDLIRKHNISFHSERTYISEDMLFNLDVLKYAQRVESTPWQFYHYCLNGASLSHSYRADRWQRLLQMTAKLMEYEDSFKDKKEFILRLKRTGIAYTRSGIAQQMSLPKGERSNGIRKVVNDPKVKSFVDGYPISQLPRNWKIFAFLIKAKCVLGLLLLTRIGKI